MLLEGLLKISECMSYVAKAITNNSFLDTDLDLFDNPTYEYPIFQICDDYLSGKYMRDYLLSNVSVTDYDGNYLKLRSYSTDLRFCVSQNEKNPNRTDYNSFRKNFSDCHLITIQNSVYNEYTILPFAKVKDNGAAFFFDDKNQTINYRCRPYFSNDTEAKKYPSHRMIQFSDLKQFRNTVAYFFLILRADSIKNPPINYHSNTPSVYLPEPQYSLTPPTTSLYQSSMSDQRGHTNEAPGSSRNNAIKGDRNEATASMPDHLMIPYELINYAGRYYIVAPISNDVCWAITSNTIITIEHDDITIKTKLIDVSNERISNRSFRIDDLSNNDLEFYKSVFNESKRLDSIINDPHSSLSDYPKIVKTINDGLVCQKYTESEVSKALSELTGMELEIKNWEIYYNGEVIDIFTLMKNVYAGRPQGMFDDFFSAKEEPIISVYDSIVNMGDQVLSYILSEYRSIKGDCKNVPAMGENGCLEFAGALLLRKFCNDNINHLNRQDVIETLYSLGITLGCAFFYMPPLEWSDKIDKVINESELLDYTEWNKIYRHLDNNYKTQINSMEFCDGNNKRSERDVFYYTQFVKLFNSLPDNDAVYDYYFTQGLRLDQLPSPNTNDSVQNHNGQNANIPIPQNAQWSKDDSSRIRRTAGDIDDFTPERWYLKQSFYIGGYACPDCGKSMYKTVFHSGFGITTTDGNELNIERTFTCPSCRTFYAAANSYQKLCEGTIYSIHFDKEADYNSLLSKMDERGSTNGIY